MNQKTGVANFYAPGSRWVNEKGSTITVANPGNVVAIQWVYTLVEKK